MPPKQEAPPPAVNRWHVGKEIPLALIAGMLFQVGMFVWALSGLSERVTNLEKQVTALQPSTERLIRLETRFDYAIESLKEIKVLVTGNPQKPALTR